MHLSSNKQEEYDHKSHWQTNYHQHYHQRH